MSLDAVLDECKKSAKKGYTIASSQEKNLNKALSFAEEKIQSTIIDFNSSPCYAPETAGLLEKQLSDIRVAFNHLSFAFKDDLQGLRDNLSDFSITLFGRTMAGKSTLMEILTNGNGDSIGKGSQRTTRDIRKYSWNGLNITDVPGIGAFEGEEDEQIAFEAAKSADLILFLITDDAPQQIEAECFSQIVNLGKPIICIMNVKASINETANIKLAIRDINKRFDLERLNEIRNQFLAFSNQYGQTWTHIPFVYVHLKSAFIAQTAKNRDISKIFLEASRIKYLKNKITESVKNKGEFYRIKTFIDIISNPILASMESLLEQSQTNSVQGRTILSKKRQLEQWKESFYRDSKKQISSHILKIKSELNSEIALFAEEHFDDKEADKAWEKLLKSRRIDIRCQEILDELETKTNDKLKEVSREITSELKFVTRFESDKSLKMNRIVDGKKIWDWSSIAIGGGLSIAAGIAYLVGAAVAGPLGWGALAATGIGLIGSFIWKSRDKKEYEARTKLEANLRKNVQKVCESTEKQMNNNLDVLISKRIDILIKELDRINAVIFKLADTQKELAWSLNSNLQDLNKNIITEAINLINANGLEYHIVEVARIPGNTCMLLLNHGTVFPNEEKEKLYRLMSERILCVLRSDNKRTLISRVIGKEIDRNSISIEEKIGVAHIPLVNNNPNIINRVRLAQQFTRLLIMNERKV